MKARRIDLWTELECNGGGAITSNEGGIIPDVIEAYTDEEVNADHLLVMSLPLESPSWASVLERRVVRVEYPDGSVKEFRIAHQRKQRLPDGKLVGRVEADGPVLELATPMMVQRVEDSGLVQPDFTVLNLTPDELIDEYILDAAPGFFSKGTIDPTDEIPQFTFDFDTALSALRRLAELTDTELQVSRSGGSGYTINLVDEINSGSAMPLVTIGKNLRALDKEIDTRPTMTRVWGKGGGEAGNRLTLGSNSWEVTATSPLTVLGAPVWETGALNNLYVGNPDGTGLQQITGSTAPDELTVATPGAFTVGDRVRIFLDAAGTEISYLEDPGVRAGTDDSIPGVLEATDLKAADNLLATPKCDELTGWNAVSGASLALNSDALYTRIGGKSIHVTAAAADEGIVSDVVDIAPTDPQPYFSGLVSLWVVSGSVRVELVWNDDGTGDDDVYPPQETKAWTKTVDQWVDISISGILLDAGELELRVVADGGAAEFYLDGALIDNRPDVPFFVVENTANELWRRTYIELIRKKDPFKSYEVELIDLYGIDSSAYALDQLFLGGTARVTDPDVESDAELRVLALRHDLMRGHAVRSQMANRPKQLTDAELLARIRAGKAPVEVNGPRFMAAQGSLKSQTFKFKYLLNHPVGKSISYAVSTVSQPGRAAAEAGTVNDAYSDEVVIGSVTSSTYYFTAVAWSGSNGTGRAGAIYEVKIEPAEADIVTGRLRAVVTNFTLDLYLSVEGGAYNVSALIYEDDPTGSAIASHTFTADAEIGPGTYGALDDIALDRKQSKRFWAKLTDANGRVEWVFTMADADGFPDGEVSPDDFRPKPKLWIGYDDDVEQVRVTTPDAKTKTWTGLSGGGSKTYQVGDTVLDDASTETSLAEGEERGTYTVEVYGAGLWETIFNGPLHGAVYEYDVQHDQPSLTADEVTVNNALALLNGSGSSSGDASQSGSPQANSSASIGATSVSIDPNGGSVDWPRGTVVRFASNEAMFVKEDFATSGFSVSTCEFTNPLETAVSAGDSVALETDYPLVSKEPGGSWTEQTTTPKNFTITRPDEGDGDAVLLLAAKAVDGSYVQRKAVPIPQQGPPRLTNATMTPSENISGDTEFEFGWSVSPEVTDSFSIELKALAEDGSTKADGTESSPVTNSSKTLTDTGGGGGGSKFYGRLTLVDASGNRVHTLETILIIAGS